MGLVWVSRRHPACVIDRRANHANRVMTAHPRLRHADETMHTPHPRPIQIETIDEPDRYTHAQIERARAIAQLLGRGRFVLAETPGQ
jgi:hypothetical protein